jgi:hypothetical protein
MRSTLLVLAAAAALGAAFAVAMSTPGYACHGTTAAPASAPTAPTASKHLAAIAPVAPVLHSIAPAAVTVATTPTATVTTIATTTPVATTPVATTTAAPAAPTAPAATTTNAAGTAPAGATSGEDPSPGHSHPRECRWTGVLQPTHQVIDCADGQRVEALPPAGQHTAAVD